MENRRRPELIMRADAADYPDPTVSQFGTVPAFIVRLAVARES